VKVSLEVFLRTGNLGDLRGGMSQDEVRALLGEPDAAGNTSRRYPRPSLFLYGTVELNFRQQAPHELVSLWWEAGEKGTFRLTPACEIVDWAFTPDWTFAQVEDYLHERGLTFGYADPPRAARDEDSPAVPNLTLPSGVRINFANGRLYGVWAMSSAEEDAIALSSGGLATS
jgi:hypothetical protein